MSRLYSSDRDVARVDYWRGVKSDLIVVPFVAVVIFMIALVSVNIATIALIADLIHWIVGRFTKSGFKMKFPAFAMAMALNVSAILIAAKFF